MSTPFTVVVPDRITDTNFVSSTLPESDHPIYSAGTAYAIGDRVIVTTGYHRIYESLVGTNTGNFPPTSPVQWIEVGPTNAWAAFDDSGGTLSMGTDTFTFVVTGDQINSISVLDCNATSVRIQASTPIEGTYYDMTSDFPDEAIVQDWYQYFFSPINRAKDFVALDVPPFFGSTYTITLSGTGSISMGTFVMGKSRQIGLTQYDPKIGIVDYSRKEVDSFGRATLIRRSFAKKMDAQIWISASQTDAVNRLMADLRATNVLWVGSNDSYNSLTVYGFYRDYSVDISYPTYSVCSLQVEGLS